MLSVEGEVALINPPNPSHNSNCDHCRDHPCFRRWLSIASLWRYCYFYLFIDWMRLQLHALSKLYITIQSLNYTHKHRKRNWRSQPIRCNTRFSLRVRGFSRTQDYSFGVCVVKFYFWYQGYQFLRDRDLSYLRMLSIRSSIFRRWRRNLFYFFVLYCRDILFVLYRLWI